MKTVVRIMVILVVAAAIAGLTLAVVNVSGVQASRLSGERQFRQGKGLGIGQSAQAPARDGLHLGREGGAGSSFSVVETTKNLAVVAVIVAVVVALDRLLKAIRRKRLAPVPVRNEGTDRKE